MHKGINGMNTGKLSNTNNKINNIASEITPPVIIKSLILIITYILYPLYIPIGTNVKYYYVPITNRNLFAYKAHC